MNDITHILPQANIGQRLSFVEADHVKKKWEPTRLDAIKMYFF